MDSFLDLLKKRYAKEDIEKVLNGLKQNRYTTFRINKLKASNDKIFQELESNNFILEKVCWYKDAYIIINKNEKDIENLQCYQKGEIYLQSLSSMLPVLYLDVQEKEDILDLAAAPGSKTTQMAAEADNKIQITAVEKNKIRYERLLYNLKKQGVTCCNPLNMDARNLDDYFSFDKVLLDAPCSGSGTITDLNDFKLTKDDLVKFQNLQVELLKKALKVLKKGHQLVYSTCSILKEENEEVILKVLKEENAKIVPLKIFEGISTLPTEIPGTICVCPNAYFEGFFIAMIEKI